MSTLNKILVALYALSVVFFIVIGINYFKYINPTLRTKLFGKNSIFSSDQIIPTKAKISDTVSLVSINKFPLSDITKEQVEQLANIQGIVNIDLTNLTSPDNKIKKTIDEQINISDPVKISDNRIVVKGVVGKYDGWQNNKIIISQGQNKINIGIRNSQHSMLWVHDNNKSSVVSVPLYDLLNSDMVNKYVHSGDLILAAPITEIDGQIFTQWLIVFI